MKTDLILKDLNLSLTKKTNILSLKYDTEFLFCIHNSDLMSVIFCKQSYRIFEHSLIN